jgi:AcrR family transcriptional regulator
MPIPSPRRADPLTEILLRSTAERSDVDRRGPAPDRQPLTSTARTHEAIVDAARRLVLLHGTRITMAEIAIEASVAKATLYNHFRTREDVLTAVLIDAVDSLIASVTPYDLYDALVRSGIEISEHPLLDALTDETSLLAALSQVDVISVGWIRVAEAVEATLARAGLQGAPTVLRWLSSLVLAPAEREDIEADAAIIVAGMPARRH